jgi:glutamine amidotransferase
LNGASNVIATTWYGYDVVAVLHQNNIWATQFHPEKSHRSGLRIIQNFALYA